MKIENYFDELVIMFKSLDKELNIFQININDFVFQKKAKINCFHCAKYNYCWTCPPRIPELNYRELFNEYENAIIVYKKFYFEKDTYAKVRIDSSLNLHKALLEAEKFLFNRGNITNISFIGGSCKLCKNGCSSEKCNNPYYSRIPLEATGVNVVETLAKYNVSIKFPVKDYLIRVGSLLW